MKFHCKGNCKNLVGYEKGHLHFAVEGKKWCSGDCDSKIKTENRECPCCNNRYRIKARTDKILQRKNQMELNSHLEIVSLYPKQQ